MEFLIKISDDTLESMVLAALEAYCLGDGRTSAKNKLETYGYVWGHRKIVDKLTLIYVSRIAISISAMRECDFVEPHPEAAILKDAFVTRWSPHLTLLGDFHTHPYQDLEEVQKISGFDFSPSDFTALNDDKFLWEASDNLPLMLVMTVCRLKRVRDAWCEQTRNNVCIFSVGEFRFWLNAAVGYSDKSGAKFNTGNKYSKVFLDLNTRFFNMRSDRIQKPLAEQG